MKHNRCSMSRKGFTVIELLIVMLPTIGYFGLVVTALAFWTERNLDFWVNYAHHNPVPPIHVPFIIDYLISIFAPMAFVLNLATEVIRYFL